MDPRVEHDLAGHAAHQRRLAQSVMRQQLALSIKVASIFLIMLFGLPLVNRFMPELANRPIWGFTASWLFIGVLFYPITWVLSWIFIRESDRIESGIAASLHHEKGSRQATAPADAEEIR